jgi:16S rRNA U1498 N3-methylase RsmE
MHNVHDASPRILRTETAGIVALTLLQAQFGDLKPK